MLLTGSPSSVANMFLVMIQQRVFCCCELELTINKIHMTAICILINTLDLKD